MSYQPNPAFRLSLQNKEPMIEDLRTALRHARTYSHWYNVQDLRQMRNRKTSWIGSEEVALRKEIDAFLIPAQD
jgi:hypothetical protein